MILKLSKSSIAAVFSMALATAQNGPPDPQSMVQMRVERFTDQLGLSTAQQARATTIFTDAAAASRGIRASLQDNRQALSAAIEKNDTVAIDQLSARAGTLSGQLTAIDSKAEAALYAILTTDQQATYSSLPHGPGVPMGGGPPRR
jgi:hypothetical protein